ncbi:hypothetical protein [Qiania dongpingensis]|uniref:Uncharacterized protein n=1 Tax=Qiania dongpingensis TaxID=2763669 RepID=A0A7G9G7R8_9FIRM|nr:hypothetical protein [Qiania dongpingensis]QNM06850.1 hypothetical protein H9Q78_07005 [Qiania dongpingensis]
MKGNKIKDKLYSILKRPISTALISSIFFMIVMIFLKPAFESSNDWNIMVQLARGDNAVTLFLSPLLVPVFNQLFVLNSSIPWWTVFTLSGIWMFLIAILFVTAKRYKGKQRVIFFIFWFFAVWLGCARRIDIVRTAAAFSSAGWISILYSIYEERRKGKKIFEFLLGEVIIILGAMLNLKASLYVLPFIVFCFIYKICRKKISEDKKKNGIRLIFLLIPLLSVGGLHLMDNYMMPDSAEWKTYSEKAALLDTIWSCSQSSLTWDNMEEIYRDLGWEKGDEELLVYKKISTDSNIYTEENLERLASISTYNKSDQFMNELFNYLKTSNILLLFILESVIFLWLVGKDSWLAAFITFIEGVILTAVLAGGNTANLYNSEITLLYGLVFLFLILCHEEKRRSSIFEDLYLSVKIKRGVNKVKKVSFAVILMVLVFITFFSGLIKHKVYQGIEVPNKAAGVETVSRNRLNYINDNKDKVYLLPSSEDEWYRTFSIWETPDSDYCINLFLLGGKYSETPFNVNRLKQYGYSDPLRNLVQKSNAYSLFDTAVLNFLKRNYGDDITCSGIDFFPGEESTYIVKYLLPIDEPIDRLDTSIEIDTKSFQNLGMYGERTMSGSVSGLGLDEIQTVFCNVESDEKIYTYQLSMDDEGELFGVLYGFADLEKEITDCYLVGEKTTGEKIYLGNIMDDIAAEKESTNGE